MPSPIESVPSFIEEHVSLSESTYYRVGGTARLFSRPDSFSDLARALRFAQRNSLPVAVMGAGTNTVFSDEPFPGLVVSCEKLASWHWESDQILYAEAGVTCTEIAGACLAAGRAGAAWMFRLPGYLGAAVRMNARCFGGEISQICTEILSLDTQGRLHRRSGAETFLGYKDTLFIRHPEIVVAARLHFPTPRSRDEIRAEMEKFEQERLRRHHFDHPSCGSTFKNNYALGVSSGQIFDELGLRGTQVGGAQVSPHHANFIFNKGGARAEDILKLAAHMRRAAATAGKGELSLEVEPIGVFSKELLQDCGVPCQEWDHKTWAGLFSLPLSPSPDTWPRELFSSLFLEYWRTPGRGATDVDVRLEQLMPLAEARKQPHSPFLRWTTRCASPISNRFPLKPQEPPGSFVPELWHSSVSEIFFCHPDRAEYDEHELTPDLHWLAIALCGPRVRKPGHDSPSASLWKLGARFHKVVENIASFGAEFSFSDVAPHVTSGAEGTGLRLQCCLSLGGEHYLLAPHWKNETIEPTWDAGRSVTTRPDFHQPQRFWFVPLEG